MRSFLCRALFLVVLCFPLVGCGGYDANKGVDFDLSRMSKTMAYAQVVNIQESPDKYVGKSIKLSGSYYSSYYDQTDLYRHYVVVGDEASCCQKGFEFVWSGEHTYPDDYPDDGAKMVIVGTIKSYEEIGVVYFYIAVDGLTVLAL